MGVKPEKEIYSIGEAAQYLGRSIMTLRRWVAAGKISCIKTKGGFRRFHIEELQRVKEHGPLPASEVVSAQDASQELGGSKQTIKRWGQRGKIKVVKDTTNHLLVPKAELER